MKWMSSHEIPSHHCCFMEEYFQAFSKTLPIFVTCCQCLFHGANKAKWLQLHSWLSDTIVVLMELLVCPALLTYLDPGRCAMCNPYKDIFCSYFLQLCLLYFSWSCTEVDVNDSKSELVQVMAWCHQATNHYLGQLMRSMSPYGITRPQWVDRSHKAPFCNRNVHMHTPFCYKNGALWDICVIHSGICEMGLLAIIRYWLR